MHLVIGALVAALVFAIGIIIGFGLILAIVYGLMWLLTGVLEQPYSAASSTTFALLVVLLAFAAVQHFLRFENKIAGFLMALYTITVGPLMYAVAFNAHSTWTHADISGARYLPGEYWTLVSNAGGWIAAKVTSLVPAMGAAFETISNNNLLSNLVAMAFGSLVIPFLQRKLQPAQAVAG